MKNLILTSVELSRELSQWHETLEGEIRAVVSLFEATEFDMECDVELAIRIVSDFEQAVLDFHGESSIEPKLEYRQVRKAQAAAGMTLTAGGQPLKEVQILLHANYWLHRDDESLVTQVYLLTHEIGHVLQHCQTKNRTRVRINPNWSRLAQSEYRLAQVLLDEYEADWVADKMSRHFLQDNDGNPVSPGNVIGEKFLGSIRDHISAFDDFAKNKVKTFGNPDTTIEALHPSGHEIVIEALTMITHVLSLWSASGRREELDRRLQDLDGFNDYFGDTWESFSGSFELDDCDKAAENISMTIDSVLLKLGIWIQELDDGQLFIHVGDPIARIC